MYKIFPHSPQATVLASLMDFGSSPGSVGAVCSSKNRTNGSKKKTIDKIEETDVVESI
jgi:hypothetical protein